MDQGAGGHAGQEGHHQQAAAMPGQHEVASSTIPSGGPQPQEPSRVETLWHKYLEADQRYQQGQASEALVTAALTAYTAQLELEREERRAQQHQGQGHTTYTRLLKEQLPAVAMGEASSNTQDHDFPPGALQAEGWPDCRADIRSWLSSNSGAQLDKQVLVTWAEGRYSPAYPEMSRGNEAEVNQDFDCAAFRLVSDCLQVVYPSQQWRWCLLPSLAAVQPDACLKNGTDGRVVAVYEGKHPEVFRHPSLLSFAGLPSSRRQGCETSAGKILRQTAGYSWALGTPYALIGTYEQIFCMQRTAPMKYRVSEGLRFMETDPSVREALYCISRKAIEEASWTPRDPPAAFDSSSSLRQVSKRAHGSDPGAGRGGGRAARGGGGTGGGMAPSTRSTCRDIGKNAGSLQRSLQSLSLDSLLSLTSRSCAWMGRFEGKTVVVKLVDGWKRMDEAARMDKEATVYGKLEHLQGVCVPRFVAVGPRDAGMQYGLVTEFVPGFHPKEGFQSNLSLMSLAEQALQAVHKAGVLHGDIEARNVLISPEQNSVCILDFGFARTVPPPSDKEAEEEMDLLRGLFGQSMSPQSDKSSADKAIARS